MRRAAIAGWVVAIVIAALGASPSAVRIAADVHVLFIGNSLTSVNDVPRLVETLTAGTSTPVRAAAVTRDNFSLDDHLNDGAAVRAIASGGWSVVVLQQGPSALPESQVQLRASTKRLDEAIRRAGARTALFMVWPSNARRRDFDGVRASYAAAARDVGGLFIPAGEAWRAVWRRDPAVALYGPDGFHPAPEGSYLAALVIARMLTNHEATSLPLRIPGWTDTLLPPARARLLQQAAEESVLTAR